jgi:hypothetical protein
MDQINYYQIKSKVKELKYSGVPPPSRILIQLEMYLI